MAVSLLSSDRILLVAPRSLNDPVCCRSSRLKKTLTPVPGKRSETGSSGVSRTKGRIRSSAARTRRPNSSTEMGTRCRPLFGGSGVTVVLIVARLQEKCVTIRLHPQADVGHFDHYGVVRLLLLDRFQVFDQIPGSDFCPQPQSPWATFKTPAPRMPSCFSALSPSLACSSEKI